MDVILFTVPSGALERDTLRASIDLRWALAILIHMPGQPRAALTIMLPSMRPLSFLWASTSINVVLPAPELPMSATS